VGALVHKTTYASGIYKALYVMFLMCADPLLGHLGGGCALEIATFLAPNGNPLPLALVMDLHASKTVCLGRYKSSVHK
jgi:hypothetical protein